MKLKTKILGAVAAPIAGLALLAVAVDPGPAVAAPSGTAVHAQAGGQGMMGGGQGMAGRGAMRPGQGMTGRGAMRPGQGMTGRGAMRPGQGMMGGGQGMMGGGMMGRMMTMMRTMMSRGAKGQGAMGQGMRVVPSLNVSAKDVRLFMEKRLERLGNKRLKVGAVKKTDDRTITADIVTVDNSLVRRFTVDRNTGWVKKAK